MLQRLATLLVVFVFFTSAGFAQVSAGAIRGIVSDVSGGVIAKVEVSATNLATSERIATVATESGNYLLGNVPVGTYRIEASFPGFKRVVRQPVAVVTATTTTLDITLEVGDTAEQVTVVEAIQPLLQTDNAELSTAMEQRMVADLPLKVGAANHPSGSGRRQIDSFIFFTPGVTGNGWATNVMGAPAHTLQSLIDGVPFVQQEAPGLLERLSPPFQAVEEFKISTTMYSADQGRGFGIANYTMKSGTNQFHGGADWLLRNDITDARGFFNATKPIIRQNEVAFGVGGPIIKNKTFFYGANTIYRRRGGAVNRTLITIPSLAFRQGDFSELRNPTTGALIPIFDPATTRSNGSGGFTRDPFPANRIPAAQISPVATNLMGLLPAPDSPGIIRNYTSRASAPVNDSSYSGRIDHIINSSHRLSASGWWAFLHNYGFANWGDTAVDNGTTSKFDGGGVRANWDWVANPTLLNHFAWGYNSVFKDNYGNSRGIGADDIGLQGIPPEAPGLTNFQPAGYEQMGDANAAPEITSEYSFLFADTLSWIRGRHQVKIGGEFWRQRFTRKDLRSSAGQLIFSNLSTSQPDSPSVGQWGDSIASLLTGEVFSGTLRISPRSNGFDTKYLAMFVDDKFQVSQRLTLSLGLRYELPWPLRSYEDIFSLVNLGLPNPAAGGRLGAYEFGNAARPFELDKSNIGPRAALAYKLNDRTVLRTGFGLIYAQSNAQVSATEIFGNFYQSGYAATNAPQSQDNGLTPAFKLNNGFPAYTGTLPNLSPGIGVGSIGDFISPNAGRSAYTMNWNFNIQRELPLRFFADFGYVGAKGTFLPSLLDNRNQVPSRYLGLGSLLQASITSPQAIAAGIGLPYPGFTGSVAQALRPYPQYSQVVVHIDSIGNHTYNGLQAKVQRRFSDGLAMLVSYAFSKVISDNNGNSWSGTEAPSLDTENRRLEKSVSPIDRTHNLITNWVYELPVGRDSKGVTAVVLKGWGVAATTTYTTGAPLGIRGGPPLPIFNGLANRPNRTAGVSGRSEVSASDFDPGRDSYLNAAAFTQPAPFTFGNVARLEPNLRGFSMWNEDFSVSKRTSITERFNAEFRAEFFNIFNRVVFANPAININTPQSFGRISGQSNEPRNIQFSLRFAF